MADVGNPKTPAPLKEYPKYIAHFLLKFFAPLALANIFMHCKYLWPNYDQIAAYGCTTIAIHWFQPLVVGCQSIVIVDIGIKEKYRIQY